ncbi:MAG: DUF72 domain-containing protein [Chitinophagaceae bacterium]
MKFDHLQQQELDILDFTLPGISTFTKKTLAAAGSTSAPAIYVGCAKWGRKEWVGELYPPNTKEADFLEHYVKHFNSIELNATHYKVYGPPIVTGWKEKAGDKDFKFCPKVPKSISHFSNLANDKAKEVTAKFIDGILAFKEHLGPVFLQMGDKFSPDNNEHLFQYLADLPAGMQFFTELRHPEWFANKVIFKNLLQALQKSKTGLVITDTAGRRDCAHMELTIPKAFVRFEGNNLHPSDFTRIDGWMPHLSNWLNKGLQELYFFLHQPDEKYTPELCDYAVEQINKHCGAKLERPLKGSDE